MDRRIKQQTKFKEINFKEGAQEALVFSSVTKKIKNAESKKLTHEVSFKQGEAWSTLSNQVVGSENF
jgi:hypothetical protein